MRIWLSSLSATAPPPPRSHLCVCVRCFSRNWQVVDYGMCDLMDLLAEIPDTTITISPQESDTLISVPKRGEEPYRFQVILTPS